MNTSSSPLDDRYSVIRAGFTGDSHLAHTGLSHDDENVRASALRSLHKLDALTAQTLLSSLQDSSAIVRRTAVELCAHRDNINICSFINDVDVFVCEMAAWALGERQQVSDTDIDTLITATLSHPEMVVREASAAALGSLGDPRGLPAILHACSDKPAVRRRAVLALAPFEGPEVDAALQNALQDNDWQVRQNAEILLHPRD